MSKSSILLSLNPSIVRTYESTSQTQTAQCSVVAVDITVVESVPVRYLTKKCCIPPGHDMGVHVKTVNAPAVTAAALIAPRIVRAEVHSLDAPKAFHIMVLARTVRLPLVRRKENRHGTNSESVASPSTP